MIEPSDLKNILHRDLPRLAKLLIIMAAAGKPVDVATIHQLAKAGFSRHEGLERLRHPRHLQG
jgi:hypothetical protein